MSHESNQCSRSSSAVANSSIQFTKILVCLMHGTLLAQSCKIQIKWWRKPRRCCKYLKDKQQVGSLQRKKVSCEQCLIISSSTYCSISQRTQALKKEGDDKDLRQWETNTLIFTHTSHPSVPFSLYHYFYNSWAFKTKAIHHIISYSSSIHLSLETCVINNSLSQEQVSQKKRETFDFSWKLYILLSKICTCILIQIPCLWVTFSVHTILTWSH